MTTMWNLSPISNSSPARDFSPIPRRGVNVAEFLVQTASRLPSHPAVIDDRSNTTWTWQELREKVQFAAEVLKSKGVQRRDTVMLLSTNTAHMIQYFWGIIWAGGVVAPPNAKMSYREIEDLTRRTVPRVIVAHPDFRETVERLVDNKLVTTVIWLGDGSDDGAQQKTDEELTPSAPEGVMGDDPMWYFFTSGSTGAPKMAVFTHAHAGSVLMNHYCDLFPTEDHNGRSLIIAPLSHGAGIHMLAQVFTGAASVIYPGDSLDGELAWECIDKYRITNAFTVPTILNKIARAYPESRGPDDHSMKYVIYAGAPMLAHDQQHALNRLGKCLVQYFGLGEVTGSITALRPEEHGVIPEDASGIGTCGRPRTSIQISIQSDDGDRLAPYEHGEVCVAGPTVCAGYLNDDKANAEAFKDGWFHTGDIGYVDEHGYLFLTGRKSDMYISGGSNVYPREIEELLTAHPSVSNSAVIGIPDEKWGEKGVAVIETDRVGDLDELEHELRAYLKANLAAYKVPKVFKPTVQLPLTAYGKVARKELKQALTEDIDIDVATVQVGK